MVSNMTKRQLRRSSEKWARVLGQRAVIQHVTSSQIRKDNAGFAFDQAVKDEQAGLMEAYFAEVEADKVKRVYAGNSMMRGFGEESTCGRDSRESREMLAILNTSCKFTRFRTA